MLQKGQDQIPNFERSGGHGVEVGLDEPGQEAAGAVRGLLRGAVGWCWPELRLAEEQGCEDQREAVVSAALRRKPGRCRSECPRGAGLSGRQ